MIKNIYGGTGVVVSNGNSWWPSFSANFTSSGNGHVGEVRFNPSIQSLEVCDGNSWFQLQGAMPQIDLAAEVQEVFVWGKKRMELEREAKKLAETSTAVADALAAVEEAQNKLTVITLLAKEN